MNYLKKFKNFEIILEGRYDSLTNKISSDIFNYWKKDFYEGKKESRYDEDYYDENIEVSIDANISFIDGYNDLFVDGGAGGDEETNDFIQVRFEIDPTWLPEYFSEISMNLKDIIRHEIEHLTHSDYSDSLKKDKYIPDDELLRLLINMGELKKSDYFRLPKEVDANLQGMYYRAKKEKRPFIDVMMYYLNKQNISDQDRENILDIWRKRAKELNLPKF